MKKTYKSYRGYKLRWHGSTDSGHWVIYDRLERFMATADINELDTVIDELESEG